MLTRLNSEDKTLNTIAIASMTVVMVVLRFYNHGQRQLRHSPKRPVSLNL